ncbi:SRPBCC family protein [Siminovitchia fortis]|uniref:SRPBCC family protein n=1 Tax=Siminovitchia fortis TaxID=254758 RepID=A0A443ILD1_9BACI|nr:SRPBCC family protein [Siminovitchia fortis]RWR06247.1 SRPBCC family protein [Siminovitchia fortis]WHY81079.1 SRPBCC family protein [Siminovitchia fortis]
MVIAHIKQTGETCIARFERHLNHSVEEAWSWLTENEKLAQWFPELQVGDLREGGFMQFDMGNGTFEKLEITEFGKFSVLEFAWWEDSVRFELHPLADGCDLILVEKINNITDHTPKDLAGWHVCLDVIGALLDGRAIDRTEEWKKWYERYVQAIKRIK